MPVSFPRHGLAPHLPDDLAAAYHTAGMCLVFSSLVITCAKMAVGGKKPLGPDFGASTIERGFRDLSPAPSAVRILDPVLPELIMASDPAARFGDTTAHGAAIGLAFDVRDAVWKAADLHGWLKAEADRAIQFDLELIRRKTIPICRAVAAGEWPAPCAIHTAIAVEATKAAHTRTTGRAFVGKRSAPSGRPGRSLVEMARTDPAYRPKLNIYERIRAEDGGPKDVLTRLKADRQFVEQVREAGLTLDVKLVRAARRPPDPPR